MSRHALTASTAAPSPEFLNARGTAMRPVVYLTSALACVVWTVVSGKDLNWDALNYHLYAGYSALNDRFAQDLFAAGATSYFNPYAHVPLYLMVAANVPALAMGIAFASLHAVNLWLTYEIALALTRDKGIPGMWVGILAVGLGALNPIFLQEVGSTFTDVSTSVLVLGGWLAAIEATQRGDIRVFALAGALSGAAAALKLSNGIFAVALVPVVVLASQGLRSRVAAFVCYSLGGAFAFALIAGPWAWRLWIEFGNPLFPLFNAWFASPDFLTEPLRHDRFMPQSIASALARPFAMALPERMIHTEPRAADIRYAALALLLVVVLVRAGLIRFGSPLQSRGRDGRPDRQNRLANANVRSVTVGFLVAWVLWLLVSGNSRYLLPMGFVAAALIASLLWLHFSRALALRIGIAVLCLQAIQISMGTQHRWTEEPWRGPWFAVSVPARFQSEPFLYLSMNVQSGSFLAPFVAPGSGLINVSGSYMLAPKHPGGDRAQRIIDRNIDRLRTLLPIQKVDGAGNPLPPSPEVLDGRLRRFGLRVDTRDCDFVVLSGGLDLVVYSDTAPSPGERPRATHFQSCAVVAAGNDGGVYEREREIADRVFDNVEDACPSLFHPRRTASEKNGAWTRHYVLGSDLQLWIFKDWVKYANPVAGGEAIVIGRVEDWRRSPQPLDCSRRRGAMFEAVTHGLN